MSDPSRPATGYPVPPNGVPTIATAYPYPYPAPPPHPRPYYPTTTTAAIPPHHRLLLRRLFAVLVILLLLLSLSTLILYLALRPRVPLFSLSPSSTSLTSLNLTSSSSLSASFSLSFSVSNPNTKLHVFYDDVVVMVWYRDVLLGQNRLEPFDQGVRTQTNVMAVVSVVDEYVGSDVRDSVIGEMGKGVVHFGVRVMAVVRFKAGVWRVRRRVLRVYCGDVGIAVKGNATNGTMVDGARSCVTYL